MENKNGMDIIAHEEFEKMREDIDEAAEMIVEKVIVKKKEKP